MSGAVEGVALQRVRARLQAFVDWAEADDGSPAPGICPDDVKQLLTTPPARSYADGVEDAAKVADDLAEITAGFKNHKKPLACTTNDSWGYVEDACLDIAAAIRLLSQGGKA